MVPFVVLVGFRVGLTWVCCLCFYFVRVWVVLCVWFVGVGVGGWVLLSRSFVLFCLFYAGFVWVWVWCVEFFTGLLYRGVCGFIFVCCVGLFSCLLCVVFLFLFFGFIRVFLVVGSCLVVCLGWGLGLGFCLGLVFCFGVLFVLVFWFFYLGVSFVWG